MKYTLIFIFAVLLLWTLWGYVSSHVEQAQYTVVKKTSWYEIRAYQAHIEAQTTVEGPYDQALNEGFRIIAGYIFGGNVQKERVAMTAPVVSQNMESGSKISMTAPVTVASTESGSHIISFVMPRSYATRDALPTPTDSRVALVEIPEKTMAVLRFSGYRSTARIQATQEKLLQMLAKDGVTVVGRPSYAGYNAPWTPPWLIRNEVFVEVSL